LGPTASGKTAVGIELARRLGAEVLSIDSMQIYRGMDIGTAKPTLIERQGVKHHMVDIVEPSDEYSVSDFRNKGRQILSRRSDQTTVIVGGSGLHFRSLVDPMSFAPTDNELRSELEEADLVDLLFELETKDPDAGLHVDLQNPRRVVRAVEILRLTGQTPSQRAATEEAQMIQRYESELDFSAIGIDAGAELDERITRRLSAMWSGGFVDEVKKLRGSMGRTASAAVGYRQILEFLRGDSTLDEAFGKIEANTRKLARRQRTWFQRDPRIQWIPWSESPIDLTERAIEVLS
jgi:tRNA dimethylallyltransferase